MVLKNELLVPKDILADFFPNGLFGNQIDFTPERLFQRRLNIADMKERERGSGLFFVDDVEIA